MNSFEWVMTTLEYRTPDCIPLDLGSSLVTGITRQAYLNLCAALNEDPGPVQLYDVVQQLPVVKESILEKLGVDIRGVVPNVVRKNPKLERDGDGFVFTDEFGVTFRKPNDAAYFSIIDTRLAGSEKTVKDIEDFAWPDPQAPKLFEGIVEQHGIIASGAIPCCSTVSERGSLKWPAGFAAPIPSTSCLMPLLTKSGKRPQRASRNFLPAADTYSARFTIFKTTSRPRTFSPCSMLFTHGGSTDKGLTCTAEIPVPPLLH